eukprot:scaffold910_cov168-Ochromonas_danica.AAC.3
MTIESNFTCQSIYLTATHWAKGILPRIFQLRNSAENTTAKNEFDAKLAKTPFKVNSVGQQSRKTNRLVGSRFNFHAPQQ